ncbi:MAG: rRNA maturation RNase YbeY [Chloroflexota bacterium]
MINVQIADPFQGLVGPQMITRAVQETLNHLKKTAVAEITILITSDEHLHQLNRQYRKVDAPTDVLSFPNNETDPDSGMFYLGDVVISYPRAQEQAQAGRHKLEEEIQLLVVHGVLHLLGRDHVEDEEKSQMWATQAEILKQLGCSLTPPR